MKKRPSYLFTLLCIGALFIACDNEDESRLTFDNNNVEVILNETVTVKVSGGATPYQAEEADETVVEATVSSAEISIKGIKKGQTTVKVTDNNGLSATIAVTVIEDPYEEEKDDATVRFVWDTYEKVRGTDAGTYQLSKAEDKTVTYSWTSEDEEESLVLTFKDAEDKIGAESETASVRESPVVAGKLTVTVEGEDTDYDVTTWRLVQAEPAEEGEPDTYWIAFTANGKSGLCVAPLTEE
jgi:hypothetical protein